MQFLLVHLVVQSAWILLYRWARNTGNDLGNLTSGLWDGRPVRSPLHLLMDAAFVANILLMIAERPAGARCLAVTMRVTAGVAGLAPDRLALDV